jgi:hypothetical protein
MPGAHEGDAVLEMRACDGAHVRSRQIEKGDAVPLQHLLVVAVFEAEIHYGADAALAGKTFDLIGMKASADRQQRRDPVADRHDDFPRELRRNPAPPLRLRRVSRSLARVALNYQRFPCMSLTATASRQLKRTC